MLLFQPVAPIPNVSMLTILVSFERIYLSGGLISGSRQQITMRKWYVHLFIYVLMRTDPLNNGNYAHGLPAGRNSILVSLWFAMKPGRAPVDAVPNHTASE